MQITRDPEMFLVGGFEKCERKETGPSVREEITSLVQFACKRVLDMRTQREKVTMHGYVYEAQPRKKRRTTYGTACLSEMPRRFKPRTTSKRAEHFQSEAQEH